MVNSKNKISESKYAPKNTDANASELWPAELVAIFRSGIGLIAFGGVCDILLLMLVLDVRSKIIGFGGMFGAIIWIFLLIGYEDWRTARVGSWAKFPFRVTSDSTSAQLSESVIVGRDDAKPNREANMTTDAKEPEFPVIPTRWFCLMYACLFSYLVLEWLNDRFSWKSFAIGAPLWVITLSTRLLSHYQMREYAIPLFAAVLELIYFRLSAPEVNELAFLLWNLLLVVGLLHYRRLRQFESRAARQYIVAELQANDVLGFNYLLAMSGLRPRSLVKYMNRLVAEGIVHEMHGQSTDKRGIMYRLNESVPIDHNSTCPK